MLRSYRLYKLARRYVQKYEGYSYDFARNGERRILDLLGNENFRTIFDVGANIGDWTRIALSTFPAAHIHSFELSAGTYATLTANVEDTRAHLNNVGLADQDGTIRYKDYGTNSGVNTILSEATYHDRLTAFTEKTGRLRRGDAYCREHKIDHIDFLKIDVEGAEHLVLEGFSDLLKHQKIGIIQFEYGYTHADAHFLMKDFYQFFARHGYVIGPLKPNGVIFGQFSYRLNGFESGPNYVAVAQTQTRLIEKLKADAYRGIL